MKIVVLALALLVALGLVSYGESASRARCEFGRVQGFVSIRSDPGYLVGTIPSRFSDDARFFERRYNCTRRSASVRRVDLGLYEVHFPDLADRVAVVSAISEEGIAASVVPYSGGVYRIALRGPLENNGVLLRRDVAFSIAIF